jgi:hypothetical protein
MTDQKNKELGKVQDFDDTTVTEEREHGIGIQGPCAIEYKRFH